ncbi:hypothetical protein AWW67_13835 [Roseivirga seohaensis]|uniref:SGNH hydrolase-type esterase domain-containing protein n=2 Tax=Roseivirga seohaensis TaxID=1914963 RepID=A0A150XLA2_9BACT|nr:hypothetical protein AWW67_13835 [Roseivirga seohaensis]
MEVLYRRIPNDYSFKAQYLNEHAGEIETLLLGNSHNYYGLDPNYFHDYNTFNAAYIVQRTYMDLEILKKYKNELTNLKTIVIPIIPMELYFQKIEDAPFFYNPSIHKYRIYYDLDIPWTYGDYFEINSKMFLLRNMANTLTNYYLRHIPQTSSSELGWGTNFRWEDARDLALTGRETARQHEQISFPEYELEKGIAYNKQILESIIKIGQEKGVMVYLYSPPIYKSYRELIDDERVNRAIGVFQELDSTYANCVYENYYDDESFVSKDFYDADHLSDLGAQKLSKIIDLRLRGRRKNFEEQVN